MQLMLQCHSGASTTFLTQIAFFPTLHYIMQLLVLACQLPSAFEEMSAEVEAAVEELGAEQPVTHADGAASFQHADRPRH